MKKVTVWMRRAILTFFLYSLLSFIFAKFSTYSECLPEFTRTTMHDDYFFPGTRWIPRRWTYWCFVSPPVMIMGNQNFWHKDVNGKYGPKPLPRSGEWQVSIVQIKKGWPFFLPYFAHTTSGGVRYRLGCRWDDVDGFFVYPSIAIQKVRMAD